MGALGRWITSLSDEERDRIVEAQEWAYINTAEIGPRNCVVGHALNIGYELASAPIAALPASRTFDHLCSRFGLPRIVRAVKKRAGHAPPVHERSEAGERNGPGAWPVTANPHRKARA